MRRSTQKEVKDIQRELALAAGHQTKLLATGRLLISELYSFYSQRGYTLTPYANGQLNLTWIGSPGEPHFNRMLTSPSEALNERETLLMRVNDYRKQLKQSAA